MYYYYLKPASNRCYNDLVFFCFLLLFTYGIYGCSIIPTSYTRNERPKFFYSIIKNQSEGTKPAEIIPKLKRITHLPPNPDNAQNPIMTLICLEITLKIAELQPLLGLAKNNGNTNNIYAAYYTKCIKIIKEKDKEGGCLFHTLHKVYDDVSSNSRYKDIILEIVEIIVNNLVILDKHLPNVDLQKDINEILSIKQDRYTIIDILAIKNHKHFMEKLFCDHYTILRKIINRAITKSEILFHGNNNATLQFLKEKRKNNNQNNQKNGSTANSITINDSRNNRDFILKYPTFLQPNSTYISKQALDNANLETPPLTNKPTIKTKKQNKNDHPCKVCGKKFNYPYQLKKHFSMHTGEKLFTCLVEGCGKRFFIKSNLEAHARIHTGEKPFKCLVEGCEKSFQRNDSLKAHARIHTGEKPFKCLVEGCEKSFQRNDSLKAHKMIHTGQKLFTCLAEGCGKKFNWKNSLKAHEKLHTEQKRFKCLVEGCGKKFNWKNSLKAHERIHTGQKPFKCLVEGCGKKFNWKNSLKTHEKIHTGQKPFKCLVEQCGKSFNRNDNLKTHTMIHTGEKPFKCLVEQCGKSFNQRNNLKKHHNKHLDETKLRRDKKSEKPIQEYL